MKKIFIFLACVLVAVPSYAGIVSYDQITSASTISDINTALDTIYDEFNGSIESANIKDDSLTEADFADEINPRVRDYEFLGNFTYTGMLPPTSSTLTSTTTAGTSYINGYRVVTAATSKTYTASKDTWVYIDQNGAFQYVEVANSADQPTTPSNSLLLATVVTDSNNITSVTDQRTTAPPGIRTYQDYRQGFHVAYKDTAELYVTQGEIDLGSGGRLRRNTSATTVTWSDLDAGSEASSTYYYVWAYPSSANDTEAMFKISTSSSDASGVSDERLVGWFYNDSAGNMSADAIGSYKGDGSGSPNAVQVKGGTDIQTNSTSYIDMLGMTCYFYASDAKRPVKVNFTAPMYDSSQGSFVALTVDGGTEKVIGRHSDGGTGVDNLTASYLLTGSEQLGGGPHTIKIRWKAEGAGNTDQRGSTDGPRILVVEEL